MRKLNATGMLLVAFFWLPVTLCRASLPCHTPEDQPRDNSRAALSSLSWQDPMGVQESPGRERVQASSADPTLETIQPAGALVDKLVFLADAARGFSAGPWHVSRRAAGLARAPTGLPAGQLFAGRSARLN